MFLVGEAIKRSGKKINDFFTAAATGKKTSIGSLRENLIYTIAGAVAHIYGTEYQYPVNESDLVFGAQAINLHDAVSFLLNESCVNIGSSLSITVLLLDWRQEVKRGTPRKRR